METKKYHAVNACSSSMVVSTINFFCLVVALLPANFWSILFNNCSKRK